MISSLGDCPASEYVGLTRNVGAFHSALGRMSDNYIGSELHLHANLKAFLQFDDRAVELVTQRDI